MDLPMPRLPGRHQLGNAATAIAALRAGGFDPSQAAIEAGLTRVEWPGRLQRITSGRLFDLCVPGSELWLDGGHNPGAGLVVAEALADLEDRTQRPLFLIAGMLNTKEPVGFFEAFAGMARHVFTVPIRSSDSGFRRKSWPMPRSTRGWRPSPATAWKRRSGLCPPAGSRAPRRAFLVCGSLYLAGDVLRESGLAPR